MLQTCYSRLHRFLFFLSVVTVSVSACLMTSFGFSEKKAISTIQLRITNSFSGTTSLDTLGVYFYSGGTAYTSGYEIPVLFSSASSTNYIGFGDTVSVGYTGSGIGTYNHTGLVILSGGNGIHIIESEYTSGSEIYSATPLNIYIDTIAPTEPTLTSPSLGQNITSNTIDFTWNPSEDTGSGIREYEVQISSSPAFSSIYSFTTNNTSLSIQDNLLPEEVLYWRVIAKDKVGNISESITAFFINNEQSSSGDRGGRGSNDKGKSDFRLSNTSFNTFSIDDPYTCGGNIWGYIYGIKHNVSISILLQGDTTYAISPIIQSNGYYYVPIEYSDITSERYIKPGQYSVLVTGTHPHLGEKTYMYDTFIITECSEQSNKDTYEFSLYTKKYIDIRRAIKLQNTEQRIIQKQQEEKKQHHAPTIAEFIYPKILQKTGAEIEFIKHQISMLAAFSGSSSHRSFLLHYLQNLQPARHLGGRMLLFLLCYDIEIYNRWEKIKRKKNILTN